MVQEGVAVAVLQTDSGDRDQWVLKCPSHTFLIPELAKVFPDARLVWAHRHPAPTVSSLCSMVRVVRGLFFDNLDLQPAQLGQAMTQVVASAIQQAPKDIAQAGLPCAHVLFQNLVAEPIAAVKAIYSQFDMPFTEEYEGILKNYLKENSKQRKELQDKLSKGEAAKALHDHRPEDFGLSEHALSQGPFQDYIESYRITSNK